MICNHNGRFIHPDEAVATPRDGAWLYGDTLFETMKACAGEIRFRPQHLDRIEVSARRLAFPFARERILEALDRTLQQAGAGTWKIRLTVSRGAFTGLTLPPQDHGHFLIEVDPARLPATDDYQQGVACVLAPNRRVNPLSHLPQMKRGNYADCLYAADFARRHGAREALFVGVDDLLLEGATSNLFLVRDNLLVTPELGDLVLPGIIRARVLELAGEWGLRTEQRAVRLEELHTADEAFLTNSLIDALPIASVEGREIGTGPLTQKFRDALQK